MRMPNHNKENESERGNAKLAKRESGSKKSTAPCYIMEQSGELDLELEMEMDLELEMQM